MDLGQIDAEDTVYGGPDIERWCVDLLSLHPRPGELADWLGPFGSQRRYQGFQLTIAVEHLG